MRLLTPPPYADGLEATITLLSGIREATLDASETFQQQHPDVGIEGLQIGFPAEALDVVLINLENAKRYRDDLRRHFHRQLLLTIVICVLIIGSTVLQLWLRWK